jgi:arginyl-tRNA synthetase
MVKIDPRQDISFDINQSISLEGNSGPYLQYTYARAKSVLRKSQISSTKSQTNPKFQTPNSKLADEEMVILRTLYKFPEVVHEAGKGMSPNLIANYLFDLAQKFNLFYQKVPILKASDEEKQFRLALTQATAHILQQGLHLLGIKTLEQM